MQTPPPATQVQTPPETAPSQQGFIIPITTVKGQGSPLVTVWINDRLSATFILDTGTNNCLISQSLSTKLGLKSAPALLSNGKPLLINGKQFPAVTLDSLRLGGKSGALNIQPLKLPIMVLPAQMLHVSANCVVDGLIGSNLLDEFAADFDFQGNTMTLCYPGSLTAANARFLGFGGPGGAVVPLSVSPNEFYSVPVEMESGKVSRQVNLLVDTGSQITQIPYQAAQDLALTFLGLVPQMGFDGGYNVQQARLPVLMLGETRLTGLLVTYGIMLDHTPRLGMDILSGYKVLLDFPSKKMYLQPIPPPKHTIVIGPSVPAPAVPTPAK